MLENSLCIVRVMQSSRILINTYVYVHILQTANPFSRYVTDSHGKLCENADYKITNILVCKFIYKVYYIYSGVVVECPKATRVEICALELYINS